MRSLFVITLVAIALACDGGNGPPGSAIEIGRAPDSGDGQTGTVGQLLPVPLRALVTDRERPVEGVALSWTVTGGGTISAAGPTDADGIAEAKWTLGPSAGQQGAQASVADADGSTSFTATALPGAAVRMLVRGLPGRDGRVGTTLAEPLQVQVRDQYENPVPGITVTWTVEEGAAAIEPASAVSDAEGLAGTSVTLPGFTAPSTVAARVPGLVGSPARFLATARVYVLVDDNLFLPYELTVQAGTTVTWEWTGLGEHNVTPEAAEPARSGEPISAAHRLYTHRFDTPGTYAYYCEKHGFPGSGGEGMSGIIHVTP